MIIDKNPSILMIYVGLENISRSVTILFNSDEGYKIDQSKDIL